MKISRIDLYQVDLPYSGGTYMLSGGREYKSFDATIVRMETDTGPSVQYHVSLYRGATA